MNVIMSGIDYVSADLARRERFALTPPAQREALETLCRREDVLGGVLLCTCNRTELYLSLTDGAEADPFSLLPCADGARDWETRRGQDAFDHLSAMACGLLSSIFAEDQILTQVKRALLTAREWKCTDSTLEVFFREAVAAAKKVKTAFPTVHGDASSATAARDILAGFPQIRRVLVVGNGQMGRAAASVLCAAGYRVSMTLRQYRHGETELPTGTEAVNYEDRYLLLPEFDAVVSATASPHYTIQAQALEGLSRRPAVYLDLAVPRDIEPAVAALPGVTVLSIDEIAGAAGVRDTLRRQALEKARPFFAEGWENALRWEKGREMPDEQRQHFPLFIDATGKTALVAGGGAIATRRVLSLLRFTFDVTVVAPEVTDELERLDAQGRIQLSRRKFEPGDLEGVFLAVAATDDRETNREIGVLARHRGIWVSVADRREECSFYFPAVAGTEEITVGVCGDGTSHHKVALAAKTIREVLEHGN